MLYALIIVFLIALCSIYYFFNVRGTVSVDKLSEMVDYGEVSLVDLRDRHEYDAYHIGSAVHKEDYEGFANMADKNSTVIVHCKPGCREKAKDFARKMKQEGFSDVKLIRGGFHDWLSHVGMFAASDGIVQTKPAMELSVFQEMRENHSDELFLVDTNEKKFYDRHHLKDAIHFDLEEISLRIDEFPKDKTIVLYCKTGLNSNQACKYLRKHLKDIRNNIYFLNADVLFDDEGRVTIRTV